MPAKLRPYEASHKGNCNVCKSEHCSEIEEKYLNWNMPIDLELEYPGVSQWFIRRHARFFGLDKKRDLNHDLLLSCFIEKGFVRGMKIEAPALLKAVEMRMKKRGELIDKGEYVIHGSDEELLAKMKRLGKDESDSPEPESDSEPDSDPED